MKSKSLAVALLGLALITASFNAHAAKYAANRSVIAEQERIYLPITLSISNTVAANSNYYIATPFKSNLVAVYCVNEGAAPTGTSGTISVQAGGVSQPSLTLTVGPGLATGATLMAVQTPVSYTQVVSRSAVYRFTPSVAGLVGGGNLRCTLSMKPSFYGTGR